MVEMLGFPIDRPRWALALLTSLLLGLSSDAFAQVSDPETDRYAEWIDDIRHQIRQSTSSLAQELDEFLSDREYENETNESRVALQFRTDISSSNNPNFRVDPKVRLRLPNTERTIFIDVLGGTRRTAGQECGEGATDLLGRGTIWSHLYRGDLVCLGMARHVGGMGLLVRIHASA